MSFYILSLKHSPSRQDCAVWWRPTGGGFTTLLADAGVFSQEEVESNEGYYNNGKTTEAWHKDAVAKLASVSFSELQAHHKAHMSGVLAKEGKQ